MNIKQMHIEIDLASQKIASNVKRKFQPEEKDWLINKTIGRFVQSKIKTNGPAGDNGFQSDVIDMNALRTLLVLDYPVSVYRKSSSDKFVFADLPGEYSFLIQARAGMVRDCHDTFIAATTFADVNEYHYYLKLSESTKTARPFYVSTVLNINGTPTMGSADFPTSLPDREMLFVIKDLMQNKLLFSIPPSIYWERYGDIYKPNSFIFVSASVLGAGVVLTFDTNTLTATTDTITKSKPSTIVSKDTKTVRLLRSGARGDVMDSTFGRSQWFSPIAAVTGDSIKIYYDKTFIVNNVTVDFIRKPKQVNLSLNQSCDLPEEFHQEICDLTVEFMKQAIEDPSYPLKVQDNQLRV